MEMAEIFTADIVTRAIKSCRNSKASGPDNFSVTNCQIPAIWKSSLIIPIPKPGKDTSQGSSYRPISLDQHGFTQEHSTTSGLLQLTTDIAMGFNQRKPPDRTVCGAIDVSAVFDTVCHNKLLSKINRSPLPPATSRWLSSYLRGGQAKTCFRGVKSSSRKVHAGVPQGSKLSPSLFSFYIADMPTPTEPVNRVCYAVDLTVWATGVNIPDMEDNLNSYLEEITAYLKDNSLLISVPKSSVTLFTQDTHQAKTHSRILSQDSRLPLVQCPKILGVHMDTSLSFNKHSSHVAERVSDIYNILNALVGTPWGQQKETLIMTYKAVGRSIINYAAPVWSTNLRDTNYRNIRKMRL